MNKSYTLTATKKTDTHRITAGRVIKTSTVDEKSEDFFSIYNAERRKSEFEDLGYTVDIKNLNTSKKETIK
jgi:hypothetical protein